MKSDTTRQHERAEKPFLEKRDFERQLGFISEGESPMQF